MKECVCVCMYIYIYLFFRSDVRSYLFVTLGTSHFWLYSEILREDSLHLLVICYCHFSLTSFILLAKRLAYSAASSLFFLVHCFFRVIGQHLRCRICGVTWRWILGALVVGFLPSLLRTFSQYIGGHLLL